VLLRLGLIGALFTSILWGIIDTFTTPTADAAVQILNPTPERVEKSRSLVDPFLAWAKDLTPKAIVDLFKEADSDVRAKLENNPLPVNRITGAVGEVQGLTDGVPAGTAPAPDVKDAPASTGGDPGIDWYRAGGGLKEGPP